jgi:hypothetical protein
MMDKSTLEELKDLKARYGARDNAERLRLSRKLRRYITPKEYSKKQSYLRAQAKRGSTFRNNPSAYRGLDEMFGL